MLLRFADPGAVLAPVFVALCVFAGGCFQPNYDNLTCVEGVCPSGFVCDPIDSICRQSLPAVDAAVDDAAVDDAAVDDAAVGDAAVGDAAVGDAAVVDATVGDAAVADAAVGDAAVADAAVGDAAVGDAAVGDAAVGDAVVVLDAAGAIDASGCISSGAELCNGVDDDCDLVIDETFPPRGNSCDGPDLDLCSEGVIRCRTDGSGVVCSDESPTNPELCNFLDDDCDNNFDEGFESIGQDCDGPDIDNCEEGRFFCNPGSDRLQCDDYTGNSLRECAVSHPH